MKTEIKHCFPFDTDFLLILSLIRLILSPSNWKAVKGCIFKTGVSSQVNLYVVEKSAIQINSKLCDNAK